MNNAAVNIKNPSELRKAGIEILSRELGALGMVLFLHQFENGYGDYTKERDDILSDITISDIEKALNYKE